MKTKDWYNDKESRDAVISLAKDMGFTGRIEENVEGGKFEQGIWDIRFVKNGKEMYAGVEKRGASNFDNGMFVWDTFHIPTRKTKTEEKTKWQDRFDWYFVVNSDCSVIYCCSRTNVFKYLKNIVHVDTKGGCMGYTEQEPFVDVPTSCWVRYEKICGKWTKKKHKFRPQVTDIQAFIDS